MSVIVFVLCLGVVAASQNYEPEYHAGYYKDTGYTTLSKGHADSFKYEATSYYHGKYKKTCSTYKDYNNGKCKNYGYGQSSYGSSSYGSYSCKSTSCDIGIYYGYNKCNRQVKLHKPYYCPGYECYSNSYCNKRYYTQPGHGRHWSNSDSSYRYGGGSHGSVHGGGSSYRYQKCTCQTVWCIKTIWAAVQGYGQHHGGYGKEQVRVNYPCRCECRQKSY